MIKMEFNTMEFTGTWEALIGQPERSGVWLVWGHSGNGKTRFALQLCKMLTGFGRVAYNTLEEGARRSFQKAVIESKMIQVAKKMVILDRESMPDLIARLKKHKSPDIILIDSIQYTGLTKATYQQLKKDFPKKLFIFISHAEGRHPEGRLAKGVRYDADVKITIEGYTANAVSRYGGGEQYVIWHEGAENAGMI